MSSQISSLSSYGIALFTKIPIIKDLECNSRHGVNSGCILPVEKNKTFIHQKLAPMVD